MRGRGGGKVGTYRGRAAEEAVAKYLSGRGYRVIARNYRTPWGELDIVAEGGGYLVFFEVKARSGEWAGQPAEAVTPLKRARIKRAAAEFLANSRRGRGRIRFDVVSVRLARSGEVQSVEHLEGAF